MSNQMKDHRLHHRTSYRVQSSKRTIPDLECVLASVIDLSGEELEAVMCAAEAQRPDVRQALCAALEAEAHRLAKLSRHAFAAADRLAGQVTSAE